ncbi:MAG: Major Facilitator Superfamily [Solirubrobacteraceae bacterium]|nr:Major Facilitator Superfamily [Solirubrobacteraceae bacterium]
MVHVVLFVASATQSAIVPLLPDLSRLHHLTAATTGLLISAPGLATLAVSAPAGLIADRFGAKRVTVAATALLAMGTLSQALPWLPALLLGRLVFGLAYGVVWTTAVAWLAGAHESANSATLGAVAASSAAGMAAGPGIGGLAAQWVGLGAPFLIVGTAAAAAAIALARQPAGRRGGADAREVLRAMALVAPRHPAVLAGAVGLAVVGAVGGVTQLLVPLDLHRAGVSTAATGLVFSAAASFYVLVSGTVARRGARLVTIGATAVAALVMSLSLLPASLTSAPIVLVAVLFISTPPRAMISTVTYPLATGSAVAAELSGGAVIGFLNGAWAIGLVLAPMLAGALQGAAGLGAGYLAAAIPGALAAAWLLSRQPSRSPRLRLAA